jgi:hypothetical protein
VLHVYVDLGFFVALHLYWYFTWVFGRKARDAIEFYTTTKKRIGRL